MTKSEVCSFRLTPQLKDTLEDVARAQRVSVSELLATIASEWLENQGEGANRDQEEQDRLHRAAAPFLGAIEGDNPSRASRVRELLWERRGAL